MKVEELEKRSKSTSGRLKDENRDKIKFVAKNAWDIYDFRNKIINEIKKEIGRYDMDNEEIKSDKELKLHRSEEELIELITNIEEDTDLKNDIYPNSARTKLLEFLNKVINKKINSLRRNKKSLCG